MPIVDQILLLPWYFQTYFFVQMRPLRLKKFSLAEVNSALCEAGNTAVLETGVCIRVKALFISPPFCKHINFEIGFS